MLDLNVRVVAVEKEKYVCVGVGASSWERKEALFIWFMFMLKKQTCYIYFNIYVNGWMSVYKN